MTSKLADLVQQQSASTGTGPLTLTTVTARQTFLSQWPTNAVNQFIYFIENELASEYERGTGHIDGSGLLQRDTVLLSSNGNALVNFSAGVKDVINDCPAYLLQQLETLNGSRIISTAGPGAFTAGDVSVLINQGTPAAFTMNVDPTILTPGKWYHLKGIQGNEGTYNITLNLLSGQIDGPFGLASSYVIDNNFGGIIFLSDGTNLHSVG